MPIPEDLHNQAFANKDDQGDDTKKNIHLGGTDDDGVIDGPTVLVHVDLAQTISKFLVYLVLLWLELVIFENVRI
jgi:hypothetical protein